MIYSHRAWAISTIQTIGRTENNAEVIIEKLNHLFPGLTPDWDYQFQYVDKGDSWYIFLVRFKNSDDAMLFRLGFD